MSEDLKKKGPFQGQLRTDDSEQILVNDYMDTDEVLTSKNKVDVLEPMDLSQEVNKFLCALCNVTFSRKCNLRRHEKKFHSIDNTTCTQVCGLCNLKSRTIVDLHRHIEIDHPEIKLNFHDKIFYCQSDFDQWKGEIERQTISYFTLNFTKINENSEVLYYKCNRSGLPKVSKSRTGKKQRHSKYAGTIKAGITCPAVIKATKETAHEATQITVQYQSTHVGHECEVGKLKLRKEERTMLANMLSSGMPINTVMDRTQAQFSPTKRLGLITRQDIYNVARDFNVGSIVHKDDAMAVDITVQNMKQEDYNSVPVYEPVSVKLEQYPANCESKEAWGYVNVRPDAYMFWWLYYTDISTDYASHPLVIWLQGGPGASSVGYGNFMEIGPLDENLQPRNETWLKKANLLFIDNPVGTGFSYVTNKSALATSNKQIADDLVTTLSSVLQTVAEFQKSPLYIFSESYGGKMTVDFALELSKAIKSKNITCNFKGIALGDSWISPIDSVSTWGQYLYSLSLLDDTGLLSLKPYVADIKQSLATGKFKHATDMFNELQEAIENQTFAVDWYNILKDEGPAPNNISVNKFSKNHRLYKLFDRHVAPFHGDKLTELMNGKIREKLHDIPKNVTWGEQASDVFEALSEDFMKPVVDSVDALLINETYINVNVYTGQLDLIVDTIGTLQWVGKLKWPGLKGFTKAPKKFIKFSETRNGGFVKSFKQFSFFWILKAGHMVPQDAPVTALQLLDMILNKKK